MVLQPSMSYAEKAHYCRQKAEQAEALAKRISDAEREAIIRFYDVTVGWWLWRKKRRPPLPTTVDAILQVRLDTNRHWKHAVADNRWYIEQATMYASLSQLEKRHG